MTKFSLTVRDTYFLVYQVATSGLSNVLIPQGRASTEVPHQSHLSHALPKAKVTGSDTRGLGNKILY